MINADGWSEAQITLFCALVERGLLDNDGKLTDKGRAQLNNTRSFPVLKSTPTKES